MLARPRRRVASCALAVAAVLTGCTSGGSRPASSSPPTPSAPASTRARTAAVPTSSAPATHRRRSSPPSHSTPTHSTLPRRPRHHPSTSARPPAPTPVRTGSALPLGYPTGSATQLITVVAGSESDTQGTLQAWTRAGRGWRRFGSPIHAWLGSDGLSPHPSEQLSAVPMGSFTLTQAFGHDPNPGTALPYRQTNPADWWISQAGPLYNTFQECSSGCAFTQGDPNEHLYYETPYYNYAVVIDYNRTPVHQGAGSAFFLHVTVGAPTQGCVSIPQEQLVSLMRWLRPADHPRILIGTA